MTTTLTPAELAAEIRRRWLAGAFFVDLAAEYGLHYQTVSRYAHGFTPRARGAQKPTDAAVRATTERVYATLARLYVETGFPPSVRELAAATGIASTSTVAYHLDALVAAGRVRKHPGAAGTASASRGYIPTAARVILEEHPVTSEENP